MVLPLKNILLLVSVNVLGFFTAPFCYFTGLLLGRFTGHEEGIAGAQVHALFSQVVMTWMICAVFSIAALFMNGAPRVLFLAAPILIPLGYGLKLIFLP